MICNQIRKATAWDAKNNSRAVIAAVSEGERCKLTKVLQRRNQDKEQPHPHDEELQELHDVKEFIDDMHANRRSIAKLQSRQGSTKIHSKN